MFSRVTQDSYQAALDKAISDLLDVILQQREAERRVDRLLETIASLSQLLDVEMEPRIRNLLVSRKLADAGLTEAIRTIFRTTAVGAMTPTEVRDHLLLMDYDLSTYSNPVGAIHTALKRLVESEEVQAAGTGKPGTGYAWKGAPGYESRDAGDRSVSRSRALARRMQQERLLGEDKKTRQSALVNMLSQVVERKKRDESEEPSVVIDPFIGQGSTPKPQGYGEHRRKKKNKEE